MLISLVIAVVVTILAAYVASMNVAMIQINLLGYPLKGSAGMLFVAAFGIGVLLGVVLMLPALVSRSWDVIRHKRRLQDWQDAAAKKYGGEDSE